MAGHKGEVRSKEVERENRTEPIAPLSEKARERKVRTLSAYLSFIWANKKAVKVSFLT